MNNRDKVIQLVHQESGVRWKIISDEMTLADDLGMDSLDCIVLRIELETAFEREISDSAWDRVETVGDVIQLCL